MTPIPPHIPVPVIPVPTRAVASGFMLLMSWFYLLNFLNIDQSLTMTIITLAKMTYMLAETLLVFLVILIGFSISSYTMFNEKVYAYRSGESSIIYMALSALTGDSSGIERLDDGRFDDRTIGQLSQFMVLPLPPQEFTEAAIESFAIPSQLNYAACLLKQGDYQAVVNNCSEVDLVPSLLSSLTGQ